MPIRPSVAHSYKHLIPLQRSPRDSEYRSKLKSESILLIISTITSFTFLTYLFHINIGMLFMK
jgi:hypothetical protein